MVDTAEPQNEDCPKTSRPTLQREHVSPGFGGSIMHGGPGRHGRFCGFARVCQRLDCGRELCRLVKFGWPGIRNGGHPRWQFPHGLRIRR